MEGTATNGYTGNSTSTKRCRREKTFAELKKEERSLLKERKHLKKVIANLNSNLKAQIAKVEAQIAKVERLNRLKRMKLLLSTKSHANPSSKSVEPQGTPIGQPHQIIAPSESTQDDTHSQASESTPPE